LVAALSGRKTFLEKKCRAIEFFSAPPVCQRERMSVTEISLPAALPDAHVLITSLHQQLQQALWRVQQLEKQLHGPSSQRLIHKNFSKEQILFSLFAPPARPAATQQVLLPPSESKGQAGPRRQPAAKVVETLTVRLSKEQCLEQFSLSGEAHTLRSAKSHEVITHALLAWGDGELHQLLESLERGLSRRIRYLISGKAFLPYLPAIISSDIDADRSDYVLRDAFQCGVAYGRFDINWLISTLTIGETSEGKLVIGFDESKAPRVVEQFLRARRALYEAVYDHKTVKIAESMLGLLIKRFREVTETVGNDRFPSPAAAGAATLMLGTLPSIPELLSLDDYAIWVLISWLAGHENTDPTLADLARRIIQRDLLKHVPCASDDVIRFLEREPDADRKLHRAVAPYCKGDPQYYVEAKVVTRMILSDDKDVPHHSYIIKSRRATAIQHYRGLNLSPLETKVGRIFTIREAVPAIYKLVTGAPL